MASRNTLQWNPIQAAGVGSPTESMANAMRGFSQAGTIFGDIKKDILDREQKDLENQFREKQFNEGVRQFGLQHGLGIDKLNEDIRHAKETEKTARAKLEEDIRNNKAIDARQWASINDSRAEQVRLQQDRNAIQTAMLEVGKMSSNINNEMREIEAAGNDLDLPSDGLQMLQQRYSQLEKESKRLTTENGKQLALSNVLTNMNRGDLAYPILDKRATAEQARMAKAEEAMYRFKETEFKNKQEAYKKNTENERKATQDIAKRIANAPEGTFFGKYQTELKTAVEKARNLELSDQQINTGLMEFSDKDGNYIFDTRFQDAVQEWNETGTGPLAVAFGKIAKEKKETTPFPLKDDTLKETVTGLDKFDIPSDEIQKRAKQLAMKAEVTASSHSGIPIVYDEKEFIEQAARQLVEEEEKKLKKKTTKEEREARINTIINRNKK